MTTSEFIQLCDNIKPTQSYVASSREFEKVLDEAICAVVENSNSDSDVTPSAINALKRKFVYRREFAEDVELSDKCYNILDRFVYHTGFKYEKFKPFDSPEWKHLIAVIMESLVRNPKADEFLKHDLQHHEKMVAVSAKHLRDFGVKVTFKDDKIDFENLELAEERIEDLVKRLGGGNLLCNLLRGVSYDKDFDRLLISYQGNTPILSSVKKEFPWGYALNVCLKHLKATDSTSGAKEYNEFFSLITDYCLAVYDTQRFDIWEDVFHRDKNIVEHLMILVDRHVLYTLPQSSPDFVLKWCEHVAAFAKGHEKCTEALSTDVDIFIKVMKAVLPHCEEKTFAPLTKEQIEREVRITVPETVWNRIVIREQSINCSFQKPNQVKESNYWKFPIIEIFDGSLMLYPKSIGSWNWYEALFALILDSKRAVANEIGFDIENFLRDELKNSGITFNSGKYTNSDKEDGECDLLIETSDADFLIECKKKVLTADAREGNDVSAVIDISDSLIESQLQCARTEFSVKKDCKLVLTDERTGMGYDYVWKEFSSVESAKHRSAQKITLTLSPYGFLQDDMLTTKLLEDIIKYEFSLNAAYSSDIQKQKKIAALNSKLERLRKYTVGQERPFFSSRFLDLEKLYYFIRKSRGNDDFCSKAKKSCATTATQDFWNELRNLSHLN